MAEQKFVKYGDRMMEVPAGFTLEQAKAQMARFFPELADPAVESKKTEGKVTWVFTKKAGKKGSRKNAAAIKRLLAVPPEKDTPADVLKALTRGKTDHLPNHLGWLAAHHYEEADRVGAARRALSELLPAHRPGGSLL